MELEGEEPSDYDIEHDPMRLEPGVVAVEIEILNSK